MSIFDSPDDEDYLGWRREAACRGADTEKFFPAPTENPAAALRICRDCPVKQVCLEEHIAEPHGVFGGTGPRTRAQLRVRMGLAKPRAARIVPRGDAPPCGTTRAYHFHKRHGEQPCRPCLDARNDERRAAKERKRAATSGEEAAA